MPSKKNTKKDSPKHSAKASTKSKAAAGSSSAKAASKATGKAAGGKKSEKKSAPRGTSSGAAPAAVTAPGLDSLDITCAICHDQYRNPHETNCCRNTMCKECLDKVTTGTCPVCRDEKGFTYRPNRMAQRVMELVEATCQYCEKEVPNRDAHELECGKGHKLVPCKFSFRGCTKCKVANCLEDHERRCYFRDERFADVRKKLDEDAAALATCSPEMKQAILQILDRDVVRKNYAPGIDDKWNVFPSPEKLVTVLDSLGIFLMHSDAMELIEKVWTKIEQDEMTQLPTNDDTLIPTRALYAVAILCRVVDFWNTSPADYPQTVWRMLVPHYAIDGSTGFVVGLPQRVTLPLEKIDYRLVLAGSTNDRCPPIAVLGTMENRDGLWTRNFAGGVPFTLPREGWKHALPSPLAAGYADDTESIPDVIPLDVPDDGSPSEESDPVYELHDLAELPDLAEEYLYN